MSDLTGGAKNAGIPLMSPDIQFHYVQPHFDKYVAFQRHSLTLLITECTVILSKKKKRGDKENTTPRTNATESTHIDHPFQMPPTGFCKQDEKTPYAIPSTRRGVICIPKPFPKEGPVHCISYIYYAV